MRLKSFLLDWTALVFAVIGIALMTLTLIFRVNPVEASVVAPFLTASTPGWILLGVLFFTCMPAYIAAMAVTHFLSERFIVSAPIWPPVFTATAIAIQALMFFLLKKGVGLLPRVFNSIARRARAFTRRRRAPD